LQIILSGRSIKVDLINTHLTYTSQSTMSQQNHDQRPSMPTFDKRGLETPTLYPSSIGFANVAGAFQYGGGHHHQEQRPVYHPEHHEHQRPMIVSASGMHLIPMGPAGPRPMIVPAGGMFGMPPQYDVPRRVVVLNPNPYHVIDQRVVMIDGRIVRLH
jgi:hypothetical protein